MKSLNKIISIVLLCSAPQLYAILSDLALPDDILMGSMMNIGYTTTDVTLAQTYLSEFNLITVVQLMTSLQPNENDFRFDNLDNAVAWAEKHNLPVRYHALVYYRYVPQWVLDETNTWTRERAIYILSNHVTTVMTHFSNKFDYVDVTNENWWDNGSWRHTVWLDGIGSNFVELAFQWAHAADPTAKLYHNDNYCEDVNTKSTTILNFLTDLRTNGVPVHGLGTQCHVINGTYNNGADTITSNFNRFGAAGFDVQITELDIRINTNDGPTEVQFQQQYSNYYHLVHAVRASTNCSAIVFWGFDDHYSWLQPGSQYMKGLWGWACPWNDLFHKKPAYYGMRNAFIPIIDEFLFNGTNTITKNTGMSLSSLTLKNSAGTSTNLQGNMFSGVNNRPRNRAFNNTASTGMGSGFTGGVATQNDDPCIDELASFTLYGWLKSTDLLGNNAALIVNANTTDGFALSAANGSDSADIQLFIDGTSVETTGNAYSDTDVWQFFAVTYDGTRANDNVSFYKGTEENSVSLVSTHTLDKGTVNDETTGLCIGNNAAQTAPFDGWIDSIRICGATNSADGILSVTFLENIRAADVRQNIPLLSDFCFNESGTYATNGGFITESLVLRRPDGQITDMHTAEGGGVSTLIPDRAFDASTTPGMGDGYVGCRAVALSDNKQLDSLKSFTLCGWIHPKYFLQNNARILYNGSDFILAAADGSNSKDLALIINGNSTETTGDLYGNVNEWLFFAVTYDGTRTTDNVVFYKGMHTNVVVPVSTNTLNQGTTPNDSVKLFLASRETGNVPFDGLMDNIRIYGSKYDDNGLLSIDDLITLQAKDTIPEPTSLTIGIVGILYFCFKR